MQPTIVHVCRHGQVENPDHILYGRLTGYGLSELGRAMATIYHDRHLNQQHLDEIGESSDDADISVRCRSWYCLQARGPLLSDV